MSYLELLDLGLVEHGEDIGRVSVSARARPLLGLGRRHFWAPENGGKTFCSFLFAMDYTWRARSAHTSYVER